MAEMTARVTVLSREDLVKIYSSDPDRANAANRAYHAIKDGYYMAVVEQEGLYDEHDLVATVSNALKCKFPETNIFLGQFTDVSEDDKIYCSFKMLDGYFHRKVNP